jgi:hypothetical protein
MRFGRLTYMRASRFTPLIAVIAAQEGDNLTLTFAEIEAITGVPLSVSAQVSSASWINPSTRFVRDLTAIGWRAHLRVQEHVVEFWRIPVTQGGAECEG